MTEHHRPIRSYVRREGRLTDAQRRALDDLLSRYGPVHAGGRIDWPATYERNAPVVVEIGFGNGEALAELAAAHPEQDYLGVEVHRPGVGRLLNAVKERGLDNVRVVCGDAVEVMRQQIPPGSLRGIQLFFPDPWPKKRHHKRRLVQPDWVRLAAHCLEPGGWLHMATDWDDYAEHMLAVMTDAEGFVNTAGTGRYAPDRRGRPRTHFEARGERKGHGVRDLLFRYTP